MNKKQTRTTTNNNNNKRNITLLKDEKCVLKCLYLTVLAIRSKARRFEVVWLHLNMFYAFAADEEILLFFFNLYRWDESQCSSGWFDAELW